MTEESDFGPDKEASYDVDGEKVAPHLAVALLCAKPRQRATQLVERPVRSLWRVRRVPCHEEKRRTRPTS